MATPYTVTLTPEQRLELLALLRRGAASTRTLTRARLLLLADEGLSDPEISRVLYITHDTVFRTRRRFVTEGLEATLVERRRPGAMPKLDGRQEAFLIALACSAPPEGHTTWTMQLLADQLVTLDIVDTISDETVRRTLKKMTSSPGNAASGASRRSVPTSSPPWNTSLTSTKRR